MSFTHLHVHSCFSLLDGSCKIDEMLKRAKELGMDSMAITDHGVMYGVIDFYKKAKEIGIKPLLGCEIYLTKGSRFEKELGKSEDRYYHLVLLAENNKGYENLVKIVSKGFTDGFYYKPRIDFELLEQYHEGIIALSACLAGEIPKAITRNQYEEAKAAAKRYLDIFGKDNFFLELQDHGYPDQKKVNAGILRLSKEMSIPMVCTNDLHYTYKDDAKAHDILLCIQTGKKVTDEDRMRYEGGQFYIKSEDEMAALFPYAPEALENTKKIADRCNVDIEFGHYHLPKFQVPDGYDAESYLRYLCEKGLIERYGDEADEYRQRMEYELSVINSMGFTDYFLIVSDFINYAKNNGIGVGPGRGSAAGSVVSYTLRITDIDPMKYNLIFERFLNPERLTMPDIDVDFAYERRQEVIDYVTDKYGEDCVSQIVTFGTLAAKGVVRDVGRVLDVPYAKCDIIAKLIPQELGMTLDKALNQVRDLKAMYENDEETRLIIDMSRRLEGLPRHTSMHAAGVVIASKPVEEFVPLSLGSDGSPTTQFTMTTIEELGLLKMDFLGLRTLTVISDAIESVKRDYGVDIDVSSMNYDDMEVFKMIGQGKCEGVFQLESSGMKNFMKELRPESLEDIIAGVSLYRPGPMDFIPKYIKGKRDKSSITYSCPQMEPILKPTYGCIVYQEQVMSIVRDLAGYSMGRSDLVRRAMSKKKADVMERERHNFVYGNTEEGVVGCVNNGIDERVANHIYDEMIDFAKYAFNKSHAACYAVIAYQTAYLRCHYPLQFFAALMTSIMDNTDKINAYIHSIRNMGIKILAPDINKAFSGFSVDGESIRFGLSAIKGVGKKAAESIVSERELRGEYKGLEDFIERMSICGINKRAMENFVYAGALDGFEGNRHEKIVALPLIVEDETKRKKNNIPGQMSLFDIIEDDTIAEEFKMTMPKLPEFSKAELLNFEKEAAGIYISGHPLDEYKDLIEENVNAYSSDFHPSEDEESRLLDKQNVSIGGTIREVKHIFTKKNEEMAFLTIEDIYGTVEIVVFPSIYMAFRNLIKEDEKVFVTGRVSLGDNNDSKLLASSIYSFGDVPYELWIKFKDFRNYDDKKESIKDIINSFHDIEQKPFQKGGNRLIIYLEKEKSIKKEFIKVSNRNIDEMLSKLRTVIADNEIVLVYKLLSKIRK